MKPLLFLVFSFLSLAAWSQISDSAMRQVRMEGTVNCRDLGGYTTADGHHLMWNRIYRSADISKLTPGDLDTLRARNIRYDVDLRGVQESQRAPDKVNPNTDYILCPAGSDSSQMNWMKSMATLSSGDSLMVAYYSKTEFLGPRYKPFFEKLLILPPDQSLLFHCTAGKDRTGIGAALFLYSLGVPYETIMQDYLATNYYRAPANEKMVHQMVQMKINEQVARDMSQAKRAYLDATFTSIRRQYGSVEHFLEAELGLSQDKIAELRGKFLQ